VLNQSGPARGFMLLDEVMADDTRFKPQGEPADVTQLAGHSLLMTKSGWLFVGPGEVRRITANRRVGRQRQGGDLRHRPPEFLGAPKGGRLRAPGEPGRRQGRNHGHESSNAGRPLVPSRAALQRRMALGPGSIRENQTNLIKIEDSTG
jgi:hypothetical protein